MKRAFTFLSLWAFLVVLAGCSANRSLPDWRIQLSFEDDISCGYYRDVQIFDDGHVNYTISHLASEYSRTLQIDRADVASLVSLVKTFPVKRSQFADRDIKNRGGVVELGVLRDELAKVANLRWEDLTTHRQVCPQSLRPLPSGQISLRDDW